MSRQWAERVADALAAEGDRSLEWWWLSFSDSDRPTGSQFLGVVIVRARGMASAVVNASAMGVNPGGQVVGVELPANKVPAAEHRNRLLSKAEAEALA